MNEVRRAQRHQRPATDKRCRGRKDIPTVASLGVQARLITFNSDQQREIADLIKSYGMLRTEWDRLFRMAIELLEEGVSRAQDSTGSNPVSDA